MRGCSVQSPIANTIMFIVLVLTAIHLDNQLLFQAGKIDHKIQEWMLTAEFETRHLPATQALPQAILGIGHMASQSALQRIADDRLVCLPLHLSIPFLLDLPHPHPGPPLEGEGEKPGPPIANVACDLPLEGEGAPALPTNTFDCTRLIRGVQTS
jgi:hypothetical protein